MDGLGEAKFVVEVSNERHTDGSPYERWEPEGEKALGDRLESELAWLRSEVRDAVAEVGEGVVFEHTDEETGKTVRAYRKEEAVV